MFARNVFEMSLSYGDRTKPEVVRKVPDMRSAYLLSHKYNRTKSDVACNVMVMPFAYHVFARITLNILLSCKT